MPSAINVGKGGKNGLFPPPDGRIAALAARMGRLAGKACRGDVCLWLSARNRTPHWLMREAISQYVEREERREAFRQDGITPWNEYQATGLHVTAAEADAWLAQLAAGKTLSRLNATPDLIACRAARCAASLPLPHRAEYVSRDAPGLTQKGPHTAGLDDLPALGSYAFSRISMPCSLSSERAISSSSSEGIWRIISPVCVSVTRTMVLPLSSSMENCRLLG